MIALQRLPDWRQRLDDYLDSVEGQPFGWGVLDCALFASGGVSAMTGHDPAAGLRGQYDTAAGAVRAIRGAGFAGLDDLAASHAPEITPADAVIGDVATISTPTGPALTIVGSPTSLVAMTTEGKTWMPRALAFRSFRIG